MQDNYLVYNKKLSFKDYMESKNQLKNAGNDNPKYFSLYEINKYCKLPLIDNDEKIYLPLKPKDKIKILWEAVDVINPIPKYLILEIDSLINKKYFFNWSIDKINKWIDSTTYKK